MVCGHAAYIYVHIILRALALMCAMYPKIHGDGCSYSGSDQNQKIILSGKAGAHKDESRSMNWLQLNPLKFEK